MMSNEQWSGRVEGIKDNEQRSVRVESIQSIHKELIGKILTQKEKEVLTLRFGIGISREQTLAQVSHTMRIHPQSVHKIEVDALKKLRTHPRLQYLRDYLN